MSNPRYIKLRNGVTFDLASVRMIARKDLNEYSIILEGTGIMPRADADDVEFMESLMNITVAPEPAPKLTVPEIKTKLAISE